MNIQGCYNVKVEGNKFENRDVSKVIIANNYVGLTGADVKDIFPETKKKTN